MRRRGIRARILPPYGRWRGEPLAAPSEQKPWRTGEGEPTDAEEAKLADEFDAALEKEDANGDGD